MCIRSKQRLKPPQSVTETRRCQSDTRITKKKKTTRTSQISNVSFFKNMCASRRKNKSGGLFRSCSISFKDMNNHKGA